MQKVYLYQWFLHKSERADGQVIFQACGNVNGHADIMDTTYVHTSPITGYDILEASEEIVLHTRNSDYYCRMDDCDFEVEDTFEAIPEWVDMSEKYRNQVKEYEVDDQSALLVFSDHREYFFEYAAASMMGEKIPLHMTVQEGSVQPSVVIDGQGTSMEGYVDIGYFPHYRHMEFYSCFIGGLVIYVENAGEQPIYCTFDIGVIKLLPGERKAVSKENVEPRDSVPELHKGRLYPEG